LNDAINRAEKAEAACAEMRDMLMEFHADFGNTEHPKGCPICCVLNKSEYGKGRLSPEKVRLVICALESALAAVWDGHYSGKGVTKEYAREVNNEVKDAIAVLEECHE